MTTEGKWKLGSYHGLQVQAWIFPAPTTVLVNSKATSVKALVTAQEELNSSPECSLPSDLICCLLASAELEANRFLEGYRTSAE